MVAAVNNRMCIGRLENIRSRCVAAALLLSLAVTPGSFAALVTFDFRSTSNGGNVGDAFDGAPSASGTVSGLTIMGEVTQPMSGSPEFNFTSGSASLGIGVNSDIPGDRPTQIDVDEQLAFTFNQVVDIRSITLQAFFLTADDGMGGPVSNEDDAVFVFIGGSADLIVSPVMFHTGDPTTYTIDIPNEGFSSTILHINDALTLAPTTGDGFRLQSITVETVPEPAIIGALGVVLAVLSGWFGNWICVARPAEQCRPH
jgi:hypothetical protein